VVGGVWTLDSDGVTSEVENVTEIHPQFSLVCISDNMMLVLWYAGLPVSASKCSSWMLLPMYTWETSWI